MKKEADGSFWTQELNDLQNANYIQNLKIEFFFFMLDG